MQGTGRTKFVIWTALVIFAAAALTIYAADKNWAGLQLKKEVGPVDVATVATNLLIALLLQYFFIASASNSRVEKDLLIKEVAEALTRISECNEYFYKCMRRPLSKKDFDYLVSACRNISNALELAEISVGKSKCKHLSDRFESLKNNFYEYKSAVTDISPGKKYRPEISGEHARANRTLYGNLQELIFKINTT